MILESASPPRARSLFKFCRIGNFDWCAGRFLVPNPHPASTASTSHGPYQQQQRISSTNTTANMGARKCVDRRTRRSKGRNRREEERRQGRSSGKGARRWCCRCSCTCPWPSSCWRRCTGRAGKAEKKVKATDTESSTRRCSLFFFEIRLSAHLKEALAPSPDDSLARTSSPAFHSFVFCALVSLLSARDEERVVDRGLIDPIDNSVRLGYNGTGNGAKGKGR
ncbi:hypothetical protein C8R45DRAFT_1000374 [Mycena sanguinolenta]|nr:hypothetical protein C8R45DRAFT_1000374 [Mycena sanguinolenta]